MTGCKFEDMLDFAVLDDSIIYKNGLYAYTHALLISEEPLPKVLIFSGSKKEIYSHEEEILSFLEKNLYQDCSLYACNHYRLYPKIWDNLVYHQANDKTLPKIVKQLFTQAHLLSKREAKETFDMLYNDRLQFPIAI